MHPGVLPDYDHLLFDSGAVRVGAFRCPAGHPSFEDTGPTEEYLFVFPRTTVRISQAGFRPVVSDPTLVMLYNRAQPYRRARVSERGDLSDWFAVPPEAIVEACVPFDPAAAERPNRPFAFSHAPSDPAAYLDQRMVVNALLDEADPDPLAVEEAVLDLLARVVASAYRARGGAARLSESFPSRACAGVTEEVKRVLADRYAERLTLAQVGREVARSPYYLCRAFRRQTGTTLHRYRNQVRLRISLERVLGSHDDLSDIGLDHGFSSHSHFTQAFHAAFGLSPRAARRRASGRLHAELGKILTV
jgi:AraC family transcriptional regulator